MAVTPDPSDLVLLADLKVWMNVSGTDPAADTLLQGLITRTSRVITSWLQRTLFATVYVETRNGNGQKGLNFRNFPVFAVNSLVIDTATVTAAPTPLGSGYEFDENAIYVQGWPAVGPSQSFSFGPTRFSLGHMNVALNYSAGYAMPNQTTSDWAASAATLLGATVLPTTNNAGGFIQVCIQAGTTGAARPSVFNQTPGLTTADGSVIWSNLGVTVMPATLPVDLTQACMDWCYFRYLGRKHVGEKSAAVSGAMTVSYITGMPPDVQGILEQHKSRVPVEI